MPAQVRESFNALAFELAGSAAECATHAMLRKTAIGMMRERGLTGDDCPVIVVPPFGTNDTYTAPMRGFLRELGFDAVGWGQGFNTGFKSDTLDKLDGRFEEVSGGEPIPAAGISIGGLFLQELMRRHPEPFQCLVTMGTPRTDIHKAGHIGDFTRAAFTVMNPRSRHCLSHPEISARLGTPPENNSPITAIHSRHDQVVLHRAALIPEDAPKRENVQIPATHIGMGVNILGHMVAVDRFKQDPGEGWRRFDGSGFMPFFFSTAIPREDLPVNPRWKPDANGGTPLHIVRSKTSGGGRIRTLVGR